MYWFMIDVDEIQNAFEGAMGFHFNWKSILKTAAASVKQCINLFVTLTYPFDVFERLFCGKEILRI